MFMAETMKTAMSYLGESPREQTANLALILSEDMASVPANRIANEFRKMSRFVPVLVLIPKSAVNAKVIQKEAQTVKGIDGLNATPDSPSSVSATKGCLPNRNATDTFTFGEVTVTVSSMETHRGGKAISLTCKEFKILAYLIKNPRRVISRDEFLNEVWGYQNYPCTRTVDNHVWQLRRKLEADPARPKHFHTVHGTGYRFLP
jgi:DNA-binding response OmpR family regulator